MLMLAFSFGLNAAATHTELPADSWVLFQRDLQPDKENVFSEYAVWKHRYTTAVNLQEKSHPGHRTCVGRQNKFTSA